MAKFNLESMVKVYPKESRMKLDGMNYRLIGTTGSDLIDSSGLPFRLLMAEKENIFSDGKKLTVLEKGVNVGKTKQFKLPIVMLTLRDSIESQFPPIRDEVNPSITYHQKKAVCVCHDWGNALVSKSPFTAGDRKKAAVAVILTVLGNMGEDLGDDILEMMAYLNTSISLGKKPLIDESQLKIEEIVGQLMARRVTGFSSKKVSGVSKDLANSIEDFKKDVSDTFKNEDLERIAKSVGGCHAGMKKATAARKKVVNIFNDDDEDVDEKEAPAVEPVKDDEAPKSQKKKGGAEKEKAKPAASTTANPTPQPQA